MNQEIIKEEDMFKQSIICECVNKHKKLDDYEIYNLLVGEKIDIATPQDMRKCIYLIRLNKQILS